MYEQIDGFSTCRDLRCVRPGELRQPWVPQHGVQNRYMCLYFALCTATWASSMLGSIRLRKDGGL